MEERKKLFGQKYFDLFFYYNGIQFGIMSRYDDTIEITIPFIVLSIKKTESPFLMKHGDFIIGIVIGWSTLIILSNLIF